MRPWIPALALLLAVSAAGLSGQIPEGMVGAFQPHPDGRDAISQLYSPFCPGFMLEVCTAQQSVALRDSIHALAYQGWTSDELVAWMLANHGEQYRAVPQRGGWGMWAWILPPVGLLAGVAAVLLAMRRFRPLRPESPASGEPERLEKVISGEEEARLKSAIREIELSEDPSF